VYQIDIAGLPDSFPPLVSMDAVPNNLPQQLTEFVGRVHELEEAKRLLGQTRMLTILAPGGTGKSRLAIQTAADLVGAFPDGVFFIGLADITVSSDIVQTIAEELGVGFAADEDAQSQLLGYLANKRQLLLFDNFEHLQDGATIVTEILKAAPNVTVLATSRTKLNLSGETTFSLGGLDTTWDRPEDAVSTSGVALFVDAAKRANAGFSLELDDLDPLAEILELTGGAPLGILLAAAWVDMLPLSEIAEEIRKSLDFLETEMGDVPDRHRSVRAVFDYSWALLSEDERQVFAALSVFHGGFTREAASAVTGASLRNLQSLVNKSLLTPNPKTGRYSVHELLRQYAEAVLHEDSERCGAIEDAHAAYYGNLTEEVTGKIASADQRALLATVEADLDNIRSAWRHYLSKADAGSATKFMPAFYFCYEWRGWYQSALGLFGEATEALAQGDDDAVKTARAMATAARGWFMSLLGQLDAGLVESRKGLDELPDGAELINYWVTSQCLMLSLAYMGESEELADLCDTAIERCSAMPDDFFPAALRNWRAFAAVLGEDYGEAQRQLDAGGGLLEARGDHYFLVWNLWLKALIAMGGEEAPTAERLLARQAERAGEIGYLRGRVVGLEGLGDAYTMGEKPQSAERAYIEGMKISEQMGMVREMLGMMLKIAGARAAQDRHAEAVELLANVICEPLAEQQTFFLHSPIRELAQEQLGELERLMDPASYLAAHTRGTEIPFETMAKEVFESA
jgi:predicted ATPase